MTWMSTGISVSTLPAGAKREIMIEGATILLVRVGPAVHAVDGICTHEGGLLADGTLEGERVVCPVHGATFDTVSGEVVTDPDGVVPPAGGASALHRYATKVDNGVIWLDMD